MYGYNIHHDDLLKGLINSVKLEKNSHAYIFEGDKGLGLEEAAKLFAAALTCTGGIIPCGSCPSCIQARAGSNIDIIHVGVPDKKKQIVVEQIRNITADAYVKPFAAKRKVYIINDADSMNETAQNAFLKVLEEPPEYVVFIMLVENSASLLQTVLSRSMLIHFNPLGEDKIKDYILTRYPERTASCDFLAKYARGVPGVIDRIVSDDTFEPLRRDCFNLLDPMFSPNTVTAYEVVEFLEENKDNISLILDFLESFTRDIILLQCGIRDGIINSDLLSDLHRKSSFIDDRAAVSALEAFIHARDLLRLHISVKLIALNIAFKIKETIKADDYLANIR